MPSLSDKLKELGVKTGTKELPVSPRRLSYPIEDVMPGRLIELRSGATYLVEENYPLDYQHGQIKLMYETPLQLIAEWAGEERIVGCPPSSFAFIDTETSGLAGGTGTFAFLVGVGRLTGEGFQLAQFFMRDPLEEPALLLALENYLAPCQTMVSFNGKAFDIPLLNTRYRLQGWSTPFDDRAHVDLLHLSRRIWRQRLDDRSLGNLEVEILGARRSAEEVPGWMIPQLYFDYLREGDARPLKNVFYHNAMDVLALAALLNYLAKLITEPQQAGYNFPSDQVAVARLLEELGHTEEAIVLYRACLRTWNEHPTSRPEDAYEDAIQRLALLYKRLGNFPAALELWKEAARLGQLYAHVELAKYYEHQAQDYHAALSWTQAALELIDQISLPDFERMQWQSELEHRRLRLGGRLARRP